MRQVTLIGNLTRDPELRTTPSGTSVCSMRVAVNDRKPDGNGGYADYTHFFDVTAWAKQAESCAQYLSKGSKVGVTGKLEWREWESDNGKRQAVQITADPFGVEFLTPKQNGSSQPSTPPASGSGVTHREPDFTGSDDDIPF